MSDMALYQMGVKAPYSLFGPLIDSPYAGARAEWRVPVPVPVNMLDRFTVRPLPNMGRRVSGPERLASLRKLAVWPAIEVAVAPDGKARLMDGNHRLMLAREEGRPTINVAFLIVKQSDERFI